MAASIAKPYGFSKFLKGEVDAAKLDIDGAQTNITDLQTDTGVLRTDVDTLQTDLGTLQTTQASLENQIQEVETQLNQATTRLDEVDVSLKDKIQTIFNDEFVATATNTVTEQLLDADASLNDKLTNAITARVSQDEVHSLDLKDIKEYLELHSKTYLITDQVNSSSERADGIKADGKAPVSVITGGWSYDKVVGETPNKINWYFYSDLENENKQSFGGIECYYVKLSIAADSDPVWLTAYSHIKEDGQDAASWYRSRWAMSGHHEDGGAGIPRDTDVVMYFSPQDKLPADVFSHLDGNEPLVEVLNHNAEGAEYLQKGLRDADEQMKLIALSSDSSSSNTTIVVKEVGYKFAGRMPRVIELK